jgi:hypothetical protein
VMSRLSRARVALRSALRFWSPRTAGHRDSPGSPSPCWSSPARKCRDRGTHPTSRHWRPSHP